MENTNKAEEKEKAINYLREKGILGEIHTKWIIKFGDGTEVDFVTILSEYRQSEIDNSAATYNEVIVGLKSENQELTKEVDAVFHELEGYKEHNKQLQEELDKVKKENEWISVEDRLPTNEDKIIYSGEGHVMMGFYFEGKFRDCMFPHKEIIGITKWKPLPSINH